MRLESFEIERPSSVLYRRWSIIVRFRHCIESSKAKRVHHRVLIPGRVVAKLRKEFKKFEDLGQATSFCDAANMKRLWKKSK